MTLNVDDLPTFGSPTNPMARVLDWRPSIIFCMDSFTFENLPFFLDSLFREFLAFPIILLAALFNFDPFA